MKWRAIILLSVLVLGPIEARADKNDRGVATVGAKAPVFIEKGSWTIGGKAAWSMHTSNNYQFTIVEGINSTGYSLSLLPTVMYGFSKNMSVGLSLGYKRNFLDLASAGVTIKGTTLSVQDYYSLSHNFSGNLFGRAYLPLGHDGRFALFADVGFLFQVGQSKVTDKQGQSIIGTYQQNWSISLGANPGVAIFILDNFMMDISLGLVGLGVSSVEQTHNQVSTGSREGVHFSYMLNLLSLSLGLYYYF